MMTPNAKRYTVPAGFVFIIFVSIACPPRLAAAEPNATDSPLPNSELIITDRPDVAEAPQTVGLLRFQVEMGVDTSNSRETVGDTTHNTFGLSTPTKLRFGIHERIELHIESDGFVLANEGRDQTNQTGVADLDFGGKVAILDGDGAIPALGVLLAYTAPTGSDPFSGVHHCLSPTLAAGWALSDAFALSANLGVTTMLSGRDSNPDTLRYAAALGIIATQALSFFVEQFGEVSLVDGEAALSADGGVLYLLTPDLQLDLNVRVGLNNAAPDDVGGGFGVSVRF